jgi:hypothetical protein
MPNNCQMPLTERATFWEENLGTDVIDVFSWINWVAFPLPVVDFQELIMGEIRVWLILSVNSLET